MDKENKELQEAFIDAFSVVSRTLESHQPEMRFEEIGTITFVGNDIVRIKGLAHVKSEELVRFSGDKMGIAFNLDPEEVSVILLDKSEELKAGQEVRRTERVMDVPVGEELLGRVVGPTGRPLDEGGPVKPESCDQ